MMIRRSSKAQRLCACHDAEARVNAKKAATAAATPRDVAMDFTCEDEEKRAAVHLGTGTRSLAPGIVPGQFFGAV